MKIIATTAEGSAYPYPIKVSTFASLVRHVESMAKRDERMATIVDEPTRTVTLSKNGETVHRYRFINA